MLRCVTAEVGAFALGRFHRLAQVAVETKGIADYVSAVDRDAETLGRRLIRLAYPDDAIVGEEHAGEAAAEYWLIDPIDGTANFLSGIPFWAVSIAYVRDGEPVLGAIALPALDALFWSALDGPLHGSGALPQLPGRMPMAFGIGRNRSGSWNTASNSKRGSKPKGSISPTLAVAPPRWRWSPQADWPATSNTAPTLGLRRRAYPLQDRRAQLEITFDETGLVAVHATMAPLAQSTATT